MTTSQTQVQTKKLNVFVSAIPSCQYIFSDGTVAHFVGGKYYTDNDVKIKELQEQVAQGHLHISVNPNEVQIAAEDLDPMEVLRKRFFTEFQAQQAAAVNPDNNAGNYTNAAQNILNSRTAVTSKESNSK